MSKTRSPLILDSLNTPKAQQIASAIESIDLDRADIADLVEKLRVAILLGNINLSKGDQALLRDMAKNYIADAPKEVKVEQKVTVEEYISVAMKANLESYHSLRSEAQEFAELEEVKAKALYESPKASDVIEAEVYDGEPEESERD